MKGDLTNNKSALTRFLRELAECLEPYSIDLSQYNDPVIQWADKLDSFYTASATWQHKTNEAEIQIDAIWYNENTGEILQYNHPCLM